MAMTIVMSRLHAQLGRRDGYPLPPREIIDEVGASSGERQSRAATLAAHFGFGALTGAIFACLPSRRGGGMLYGVSVWALSYLGWIPAAGLLAPAWRHPARRNLLMIAAHVVWGAVLAGSLRELEVAEREAFGRQPGAEPSFLELLERGKLT